MPRANWRCSDTLLCFFGACSLAWAGSTAERVLAADKILEIGPVSVASPIASAATGDSIHLTASNPPVISPSSILVTENSSVRVPDVEVQAGAAWYGNPETGRVTTVHWEVYVEDELSGSGSVVRRGVPTAAEWDEWHADEGAYPYGSDDLTNDRLKFQFDLIGEAEAFNEGTNVIRAKFWGSTWVWRNNYTPGHFLHTPTEKKEFNVTFTPGAPITVGVPYTVWKDPVSDEITKPHPAMLTVNLRDRNDTRPAYKGNVQEYEQPTVRSAQPNGTILPGGPAGGLVVASDSRTHAGTHPPFKIHVTPDFAPIKVDIYHRQWDLQKNRGREYHRFVPLQPTALYCIATGSPEEEPPTPPNPPIGGVPGAGQNPSRGVTSPGGAIQPPNAPVEPVNGSVRVRIVSLLMGNPTLEFDASADADGNWSCGDCVESGDQVELQYTFRDLFGRHFADTISLSVPDSLDLDAPETLLIRQPLLVVVETETALEPSLSVDTRAIDLASAAFGVLRPLPGIEIADVIGGAGGISDETGAVVFDVPHGAVVQVTATDPLGRYLQLRMPATPGLATHLSHREVTPGQWRDDRMFLWMTPSFSRGRLHLGSGRIDDNAGELLSRIGAVSNIDPPTVSYAHWETLEGFLVGPATMQPWGLTPPAEIDYVPALFALAPPAEAGNGDPAYQAALQAIVAAGGARLRVGTLDALEHVLDIPLEGTVTSSEISPRPVALELRVAPNPFNPSTTLAFELQRNAHVRLTILGVDGRQVTTLIDGPREAGTQRVVWNGRDERNAAMPSGVYIAKLEVDAVAVARKVILFK